MRPVKQLNSKAPSSKFHASLVPRNIRLACSNADPSAKVKATMEAEAQLLARCRRGDADAWDELFDRHYAAAGRFVFQLGSDFSREDVEEICQEVFLSVIKNLNAF